MSISIGNTGESVGFGARSPEAVDPELFPEVVNLYTHREGSGSV